MQLTKLWVGSIILIIVAALLFKLSSVVAICITAALIAFFLTPPVDWLMKRIKIHRSFAIIAVILLIIAIICLIVFSFVPMLFNQLDKLMKEIPDYLDKLPDLTETLLNWLENLNLPAIINNPLENMINGMEEFLGAFLDSFLNDLLNNLSSLAKGIVDVFFIIILTVYLLIDGKKIVKSIKDFLPEKARAKLRYFADSFNEITWRWLKNHVKISLIFASAIFLMLVILGVEFAPFLAFLAFVLDFIPIVGSIIAGLIACLVTFVTLDFGKMVLVGFLILFINQVEVYVLVPKIHSGSARIHPVAVLVAILALNQLFGILGMFLAIPVAGLMKILIIEIRNFFAQKQDEK